MFSDMSSDCESYYTRENVLVGGFTCPKSDSDSTALFCCGFSDLKYCCDDPNSFFPYKYGYMWWLSLGALVGLSVAAVVLLAFIITLCVLCYLFITTKPRGLDNGLSLQAPGSPPCDCAAKRVTFTSESREAVFRMKRPRLWLQLGHLLESVLCLF
uniref:Shisa like 2A n=1 Tax=Salarias fasciatus TaxID=181472 RepID=A0A672G877_SALFA